MKQALLDTNFIISCTSQKIDFIHDLKIMGYEIIIPQEVIKEINGLSNSKGKGTKLKISSNIASNIINLNREQLKIVSIGEGEVDNQIVKYAKLHPETVIATLDNELKSKIKASPKIVIRDRRSLEVSSK
jgi:rRNA-processing protein FCF1